MTLTPGELLAEHADRRGRAVRDKPGLADTLLTMAERPGHGSVRISTPELAEGLAKLLIAELREANTPEAIEVLKQRRPIVRFVIERLCPALNPSRPIS